MTDIVTPSAPEGAIRMSSAIMGKVNSSSTQFSELDEDAEVLPAPFGDLPLDTLLTVLAKIGLLASTPPDQDSPVEPQEKVRDRVSIERTITCEEASQLMVAADRVIQSWPRGMDTVFSSIADRNPNASQEHPVQSIFATQIGYRLLARSKSLDGKTISLIDDALADWLLRERGIYIDGRQRSKVRRKGDIAIDVADALRRLEGRVSRPESIFAWADAGAVKLVGKKVSLSSVEATAEQISKLESSDFPDSMGQEDWSTRFLYNMHFKRGDAIRDVLGGKVRIQRVQDEKAVGLASIRVCRSDLLRCIASAEASNRSSAKAHRARKGDRFRRPGQIHALLAELWPGHDIPDVTTQPGVRCITSVKRYNGRDMKQRRYSVVDALDLMEAQLGEAHHPKRGV